MAKIKEENVDIINWKYIKEKDRYTLTFKISNLKPEIRKRIIKRQKSGFLKSQGADILEIIEVGENLHVKEHYEKEDMEVYSSLIPFAQNKVIPERLDPEKVGIEEDLCMIEQDMKFRMDYAGRTIDKLNRLLKPRELKKED